MPKNSSRKKWYLVYVPKLEKEVNVVIRPSALISTDTVRQIVDCVDECDF